MSHWNWLRSHRTGRTLCVLALLGAVTLAGALGVGRWFGRIHLSMVWNLFLAAIPLALALWIARRERLGRHGAPSIALGAVWLVFFPNAPYMISDLIHLSRYSYWGNGGFLPDPAAWLGLLHIVMAVLAGCTCGLLSLYLLHRAVRTRLGGAAGWGFVLAVSLLAGVGIHLGRFQRFNTWDLLHRPWGIVLEALSGFLQSGTLLLYLTFSCFTLLPYLLFYACWGTGEDDPPASAPQQ